MPASKDLKRSMAEVFATPVWIIEVDRTRVCSQKIRSYIDRERAGSASPRQRSLGGNGWKGPDISDLQLQADLRDLGDFTLEVCEHILKPSKQELMITSPGINIQGQGGFNYRHVHSNSLLSCVYYLQLPESHGAVKTCAA